MADSRMDETAVDFEELRKYMRKHPDILCLSDEIYEKITDTVFQHVSVIYFQIFFHWPDIIKL